MQPAALQENVARILTFVELLNPVECTTIRRTVCVGRGSRTCPMPVWEKPLPTTCRIADGDILERVLPERGPRGWPLAGKIGIY